MTPKDFVYWLQGYIEIANPQQLNKEELEKIKEHLQKVIKYEPVSLTSGNISIPPYWQTFPPAITC